MRYSFRLSVFFLGCVALPLQAEKEYVFPDVWEESNQTKPYYYPVDKMVSQTDSSTYDQPYSSQWDYYCLPTYQQAPRHVYPAPSMPQNTHQANPSVYPVFPPASVNNTQTTGQPVYPTFPPASANNTQVTGQAMYPTFPPASANKTQVTGQPTYPTFPPAAMQNKQLSAPDPRCNTSFMALQKQFDHLSAQYSELLMSSSKTIEIQATGIEELQQKLAASEKDQSQHAENETEIENLKILLTDVEKRLTEKNHQFKANEKEFAQKDKQIVELQQQLATEQDNMRGLKADLEASSQAINEQKEIQIAELQKQLATAEEKISGLNAELESSSKAKTEAKLLLGQYKGAEVEVNNLKLQLTEAGNKIKTLDAALAESKQRASDTQALDQCRANAEAQQTKLNNEIKALSTEKVATGTQLAEAQQQIAACSDLQSKLANAQAQNEAVSKQLARAFKDTDADGVIDQKDQCPSSPESSVVDGNGCVNQQDTDKDGIADQSDQCPTSPQGVKVDENGCALDSDNDGVIDGKDQCPTSPENTLVDTTGCTPDQDADGVADSKDQCPVTPSETEVDQNGCSVTDTDNDGITDRQDECPETAAGTLVDPKGCAVVTDVDASNVVDDTPPETTNVEAESPTANMADSDGDKVADANDLCPDTAAGEKVNEVGCALTENINLKGVQFQTGSVQLAAASLPLLDDAAATLAKHPNLKIEVGGHTDNRGSVAGNENLSQRRAETVMNYLISKGVAADNLSTKGYGPAQPIADNATVAGRAENRRVELKIQN